MLTIITIIITILITIILTILSSCYNGQSMTNLPWLSRDTYRAREGGPMKWCQPQRTSWDQNWLPAPYGNCLRIGLHPSRNAPNPRVEKWLKLSCMIKLDFWGNRTHIGGHGALFRRGLRHWFQGGRARSIPFRSRPGGSSNMTSFACRKSGSHFQWPKKMMLGYAWFIYVYHMVCYARFIWYVEWFVYWMVRHVESHFSIERC